MGLHGRYLSGGVELPQMSEQRMLEVEAEHVGAE